MKSRMKLITLLTHMDKIRHAVKILVQKSEEKMPLEGLRFRWKD
jgi:hypothetical protein